eukprot:comp23349_c0_seq1/m.58658 comp23349_c0_seq1/g.58658  ORF comp23349_c0_seq1/g.58658 comp23349_c0_seq1/m.58658 type:complete len:341 (-) comp23349_c0_seq1:2275-3297(-)
MPEQSIATARAPQQQPSAASVSTASPTVFSTQERPATPSAAALPCAVPPRATPARVVSAQRPATTDLLMEPNSATRPVTMLPTASLARSSSPHSIPEPTRLATAAVTHQLSTAGSAVMVSLTLERLAMTETFTRVTVAMKDAKSKRDTLAQRHRHRNALSTALLAVVFTITLQPVQLHWVPNLVVVPTVTSSPVTVATRTVLLSLASSELLTPHSIQQPTPLQLQPMPLAVVMEFSQRLRSVTMETSSTRTDAHSTARSKLAISVALPISGTVRESQSARPSATAPRARRTRMPTALTLTTLPGTLLVATFAHGMPRPLPAAFILLQSAPLSHPQASLLV